MLKKYGYLFLVSGIVILLDQLSKILVRSQLLFGAIWAPWPALEEFFKIVHWKNTGMFMGVLEGFGLLFTLLAVVVAAAGLYFFPRIQRTERALRLGFSLQLGGVVGNLIDRLVVGHVTDFISIRGLPVMNIADIAIYAGLLILAFSVLLRPENKKNQAETASPDRQP